MGSDRLIPPTFPFRLEFIVGRAMIVIALLAVAVTIAHFIPAAVELFSFITACVAVVCSLIWLSKRVPRASNPPKPVKFQFTIRRAMVSTCACVAVYLALALAPNNRIGSVRMLLMLPMLMICYVSYLGFVRLFEFESSRREGHEQVRHQFTLERAPIIIALLAIPLIITRSVLGALMISSTGALSYLVYRYTRSAPPLPKRHVGPSPRFPHELH